MRLSELLAARPDLDADIVLDPEDYVGNLFALLRIVRLQENTDGLVVAADENTTGIVQYGLVCAAKLQLDDWMLTGEDRSS